MVTQITKYRRNKVINDKGNRCYYCGDLLNSRNLNIDHFNSRIQGGKNNVENLVPSCTYCNTVKGGRNIEEFRERIYELAKKPKNLWLYLKFDFSKNENIKFYFERLNGNI